MIDPWITIKRHIVCQELSVDIMITVNLGNTRWSSNAPSFYKTVCNLLALYTKVFLLLSCSANHSLELPNCFSDSVSNITITADTTDILTRVPTTARFAHRIFDYVEDSDLYYGLEDSENRIDVFKLDSGFVRSILLTGPEFDQPIANMMIHTKDSIFLTVNDPYKLVLINQRGELINSWKVNGAPVEWQYAPDYYHSKRNFQKPIVLNNLVHIAITPFDFYYHSSRADMKLFSVYNLKERTWTTLYGVTEGIYTVPDIVLPDDFTLPNFVYANGSVWVSYPLGAYAYQYNAKGEFMGKKCIGGSVISTIPEPPALDSDIQQEMNYLLSAPYYGNLSYHSKLKVFSRIVFHEIALYANDGKLNKFCNRNLSIQLFDENMNPIIEKPIEHNITLLPGFFIATSDGFITGTACSRKKIKEDYLTLNTRIKFKIGSTQGL